MTPTADGARPDDGLLHIPYRYFTAPEIYRQEMERVFRGPTWSYVGLEAEVPNPGDFRTTQIGDTPVVLVRALDGEVHVLVNRCAHRGALVVREAFGNRKRLNCVYHQWGYALDGALCAVPFKNGTNGEGGYGPDFDTKQYGMPRLQTALLNGLVFATFHPETPPLEVYLGGVLPDIQRLFDGRPLTVLGYLRQRVHANWKLYFENTKDPSHASLLHLFVATFGLFRTTQRGMTLSEPSGCGLLLSYKADEAERRDDYEKQGISTYRKSYQLKAPEVIRTLPEKQPDDVAVSIQTVFPSLVNHRIANSIATRNVIPSGPDAFDLLWTFVGYEDDSPELTEKRVLHTNLVGPSGYVSLEDVEALEIIQRAIGGADKETSFIGRGGSDVPFSEPVPNLTTEAAIRGFWKSWRNLMGVRS